MAETKNVLIVDDEPDAIDITEAMLSEIEGIETASANNGDVALEKLAGAEFDLVILDVQMPGQSGFDVFAKMRKNDTTKDIPVIMLTGIRDKTGIGLSSSEMDDYIGSKPDAFIEKPVQAEELQNTVKNILGL